jgi:glycerophosphoryl diester phosphodiesterase
MLKNYAQLLGPQTKIISFDLITLEGVDKMRKDGFVDIDTGFLYEHKPEKGKPASEDPIAIAKQIGAKYIIPDHKLLELSDEDLLSFVDRAAKEGVGIGTWTVDSLEEAERLKGAGIKSITTNEPEKFFGD